MARYVYSARSCQNAGQRAAQQDACLACDGGPRGMLAVLSDGMGGAEAGERFSALAVREMERSFRDSEPTADPCWDLLTAYHAARARALALRREEEIDGGATVAALLLRDGACAFLSVGDSRVYLLRGGGLIQINREQTLGALLDEQAALGFLPREEAENNRRRGALLNQICEPSDWPADRNLSPFALLPGDRLALLSDGAYRALEAEELAKLLALPDAAEAIVDAVLGRELPEQDNLTALVIDVLDAATEEGGDARG